MWKNWLLQVLMVGCTLVVALMSSGIAEISSNAAVYAQGLAATRAHLAPPKGPDLGRFAPTIRVPQQKPTAWSPRTSTAVAPKATQAPQTSQDAPHLGAGLASGRKPGEQPDLRTAASSTILNADGSWTLESYSVPIHYQDAQGKWQSIDTSMNSDTSDGGYGYSNKANGWHVYFATQAGGSKLLDAHLPGLQYSESLPGAASVSATISGSTLTYPAIFPNVDAIYTMMHTHMEETFLLHSANAPTSFTLTYHVAGATASQDQQGNIIFSNSKGVA
ncbi:MAG: hypothetical protein ACRDID_12170, partial [Ktedonobacterales bacterium]